MKPAAKDDHLYAFIFQIRDDLASAANKRQAFRDSFGIAKLHSLYQRHALAKALEKIKLARHRALRNFANLSLRAHFSGEKTYRFAVHQRRIKVENTKLYHKYPRKNLGIIANLSLSFLELA